MCRLRNIDLESDRRTDEVIPMCRYASQAKKLTFLVFNWVICLFTLGSSLLRYCQKNMHIWMHHGPRQFWHYYGHNVSRHPEDIAAREWQSFVRTAILTLKYANNIKVIRHVFGFWIEFLQNKDIVIFGHFTVIDFIERYSYHKYFSPISTS